ncbi:MULTISPECIES: DUF5988 family protein [Micromonospora]|nr:MULTISPECIES: DUF5988 family protein [Micromonospora]
MTTSQVKVRLEGGPNGFPDDFRARLVSSLEPKIKVRYGCGYEHFERTEESLTAVDGDVVIYRWTAQTRVAE